MLLADIANSIEISTVQSNHSLAELTRAARLAQDYGFSVVYSLPCFTKELACILKDSSAAVGGVVSFPSGGETTAVRVFMAQRLLEDGAQEFDMVLNIGYLKAGRLKEAREDVEAVKKVIAGRPLKLILEVCHLSEDELRTACQIAVDGGADYAKTGTGWLTEPTAARHIQIMSDVIGGRIKMKASGGIRTLDQLLQLRDMGVSRFGIRMDSAVAIYNEARGRLGG